MVIWSSSDGYDKLHFGLSVHVCYIDVACAVTTRVSDLVSQNRTIRLGPKVYTELMVELHSTVFSVYVYHQHH